MAGYFNPSVYIETLTERRDIRNLENYETADVLKIIMKAWLNFKNLLKYKYWDKKLKIIFLISYVAVLL